MTPVALIAIAPTVGKLLRLLSSSNDGEVLASARALGRVLGSVGLSFHDLADAIELRDRRNDDVGDWRAIAKACARHSDLLSTRELLFVMTMTRWRGHPTRRQSDWLQALYDRVREAA
jgi:hypothetical protein